MLLCDKVEIVIYLNNFPHHVCIIDCHITHTSDIVVDVTLCERMLYQK